MSFYVVLALITFDQAAYKGSKMLISLYAIELGAAPIAIGVLFSLNSLCSLVFALYAGKLSDRFGSRMPMLFGSLGLALGLLLPYLIPGLTTLYATACVIGACYIFFTVSTQHAIGAFGSGDDRTRYIGIYSIAVSLTALLGPTLTGFSIDLFGQRLTFLLLALLPLTAAIFLWLFVRTLPHSTAHLKREGIRTIDLLRKVSLRRALIVSGIIETGGELYSFYMPIYGHSLKLSASTIGMIIASYAVATILVRFVMPALVKRSSEEIVIFISLGVAASIALVFPMVSNVYLLAVISFVLGLGLGCCNPLALLIVYNRAPEGRAGEAVGVRLSVNKSVEVIFPVIFGAVGSAFGFAPVFWTEALLLAAGSYLMKHDARRRAGRAKAKEGDI